MANLGVALINWESRPKVNIYIWHGPYKETSSKLFFHYLLRIHFLRPYLLPQRLMIPTLSQFLIDFARICLLLLLASTAYQSTIQYGKRVRQQVQSSIELPQILLEKLCFIPPLTALLFPIPWRLARRNERVRKAEVGYYNIRAIARIPKCDFLSLGEGARCYKFECMLQWKAKKG